jgi:acyl-coenzyme A thioesterase PaaI-like protein
VVRLGRRVCTVEARATNPEDKEVARGLATLLNLGT